MVLVGMRVVVVLLVEPLVVLADGRSDRAVGGAGAGRSGGGGE